ncbi:MAG TPA: hypothetical protein VF522_06995 [Ramlibacter sp.]|uniref:hypothetical protein n=1 Tax=Ramlibacter sp. TaxID=1917967 RepID=UPI002ED6BE04
MNTLRPTCTWPHTVAACAALVEYDEALRPLLSLTRFLATSRYAGSIVPRFSGGVLTLVRTPDAPAGQNELQIRFDPASRQFHFTYQQRPDDPRPWSRECDAQEGQAVLERIFHKRLHWFHEG